MRATPRYLIGSAGVLTGVILLAAAWALTREPPPLASCRLPDGTDIRLEAVTHGPVHRFKNGPYWQRLLARAPLHSLRALAGDPVGEIRGATPDSLVFWTTREVRPNEGFGGGCEVVNEQGCAYAPSSVCDPYPPNTTLTGLRVLECFEAITAPRRERKIGLRLRLSAGTYDLLTTNPWPGPYPVWQPERLPAAKQAGDLQITLTALVSGVEILDTNATSFPMHPVLSQAHIRLTWRGKPSADWLLVGASLRDPTGNVLVPYIYPPVQLGDQQVIQFQDAFCADETIWKVRLELSPSGLSSADPADLWTIASLPLPRPHVFRRMAALFSRHGVTVRLRGLAGSWARVPSDDGPMPTGESSDPRMTVQLQSTAPVPGVHLLLLRAMDDRGRPVQTPLTGDASVGEGGCAYPLRTAPGAHKVTLVFAMAKSRFVEFTVRPSRAQDLPKYAPAR